MLKMDENTLLREAKDINLDKVQQAIKQVRLSERWGIINGVGMKKSKGRSNEERREKREVKRK